MIKKKLLILLTAVLFVLQSPMVALAKEGIIPYTEKPATQEERQAVYEQIVSVHNFVKRLYSKVLGREADYFGETRWVRNLWQQRDEGAGVVAGFFYSPEFLGKAVTDEEYVNILYATFFDRLPDPAGKENWMNALAKGESRGHVLAGFVNSNEFTKLCDQFGILRGEMNSEGTPLVTGVEGFVDRLYKKALGRGYDEDGFNEWVRVLKSQEKTPEEVSKSFFFSSEYVEKNLSNEEYVETLYETFLGRESDQAGKTEWVSTLETGKNTRDQVLNGFAESQEFGRIVDSYGLNEIDTRITVTEYYRAYEEEDFTERKIVDSDSPCEKSEDGKHHFGPDDCKTQEDIERGGRGDSSVSIGYFCLYCSERLECPHKVQISTEYYWDEEKDDAVWDSICLNCGRISAPWESDRNYLMSYRAWGRYSEYIETQYRKNGTNKVIK